MNGGMRVTTGGWRASSWIVGAVLALALVVGCRHVAPDVAAPPVASLGGAPSARLEAGRAIYLGETKCARCHSPKPVADYPADKWTTSILPRMAKKSKLTPQEYEDLKAYVLAAAGAGSQTASRERPFDQGANHDGR